MGGRSLERFGRTRERNAERRATLSEIIRECRSGNFSGLTILELEEAMRSSVFSFHGVSEEEYASWREKARSKSIK